MTRFTSAIGTQTPAARDNLRGAALMSLGMASFVFNDAAIKFVGSDVPLFQAIFVRGLIATALIGVLGWRRGVFRHLPDRRDSKLIGLRAAAEVGTTICFLIALLHMPLANVTAILQSVSLVVALAAVIFLGERVGPHRAFAIVLGFIGVLVIIRPGGDGFNIYSLLALAAVIWITCRDLLVRKLSVSVSSLFVTFVTAGIITLVAGVFMLILDQWIPLNVSQLAILALTAVFLFIGYFCAVSAMRFGEMSFVTPFRYTSMIWAIGLGWLVFGDFPDRWTASGMAIIVGAGLYSWWRDHEHNA